MTKIAASALVSLQIGIPAIFLVVPRSAEASIFSFVTDMFSVQSAAADANTDTVNSQKMPLLEAPVNSNVNAGASSDIAVQGDALVAEAASSETDAPIKAPTNNQITTYKVQSGDTVTGIAKKFGISANTVLWANNLKRTSSLSIGQSLVILPISGVEHKVVSGDTLQSIAKKYKGDVNEIVSYNNLDNDKLKIGDIVVVPDGELVTPTTSSAPVLVVSKPKTAAISQVASAAAAVTNTSAATAASNGYYIRPIKAGTRTQGLHGSNGVDLADACGTPIYASAAGDVIVSKDNGAWDGGYGNYVVISHPNGSQTLYAHMQQALVSEGARVAQGQMIGLIGATGKVQGATGCHLHFEIRGSGAPNPF